MTVTAISDEALMALADGELGREEALELRARLARDHELAARYALFVETRALAQKPVSEVSSAMSDPLAKTILAMDRTLADGAAGQIGEGRPRLGVIEGGAAVRDRRMDVPAWRQRAVAQWALPAAAALVFVLGNITGHVFAPGTPPATIAPTAGILVMPVAQETLDRALTRTPSGQEVAWSDQISKLSGRIFVVSTHRLDDGTVCREYEISARDGDHGTIVGASCRRGGHWRTEIALTAMRAGSAYTPASGMAAVEDYLTNRGSSGPLAAEDERALIDRDWRARRD
jgi:anti-sigma factor RsiW